jgi:protein-L-isoaspartate(D-aspartate) O-methyltransferase
MAAAPERQEYALDAEGSAPVPPKDPAMPHPTHDLRSRTSMLAALGARYDGRRADPGGPVPPELDAAIAADAELSEAARGARKQLVAELAGRFEFPARFLAAILAVPRERFVLPEDIAASADDAPRPLDRAGNATVSAPHAYLLTYDLLGLTGGDHLLELGTGTGYGAALARRLVGSEGHVVSIEIEPALYERAARLLGASNAGAGEPGLPPRSRAARSDGESGVTLFCGDGRAIAERVLAERPLHPLTRPWKIALTYAVSALPVELERLLPEGGVLVAPVGVPDGHQELTRVERRAGALCRGAHGPVRYVSERTGA